MTPDCMVFDTLPLNCHVNNYHVLAEIDIDPKAESATLDLQVDPGRSLTVTRRRPRGEADRRDEGGGRQRPVLDRPNTQQESPTIEIHALDPSKPRRVIITHAGRKLIGSVYLKGDETGPLTVRLQPWGTITGRIVDDDGQPRGGLALDQHRRLAAEAARRARHPARRRLSGGIRLGRDGRFRVEGLVPGLKYGASASERVRVIGELFRDVTVAPGEVKDLGDLKSRPAQGEPVVRLGRLPSAPDAPEPEHCWARYEPTDRSAPWDLRRVVHLHRRAGFAATWDELQRDLKDGPEASIDRLLDGKSRTAASPTTSSRSPTLLADAAVAAERPGAAQGVVGLPHALRPRPAGRAADAAVAQPLRHQQPQGRRPRRHAAAERRCSASIARAPFGELLEAAVRDPALLIWLDAPANRKGHPNENLARELMELFTLGIGHYTETDVKEAARALTGWTVADGAFRDVAARHDDGEKTILGGSGRWTGDDLVAMLLDHPATAERLAWRLCGLFMGEGADRRRCDRRAGGGPARAPPRHRLGGRDDPAVAGVLRRREPRHPGRRARSSSSSARCGRSSCSTRRRARWCWPTGRRGWGRTCSTRPTSAAGPAAGAGSRPARSSAGRTTRRPWSTAAASAGPSRSTRSRWPRGMAAAASRDDVVAFCAELLLGGEPDPAWHARIAAALGPESEWGPDAARRAVALDPGLSRGPDPVITRSTEILSCSRAATSSEQACAARR